MAVSFPVTKLRSETGSSRICFATVISFCMFSGAELSSAETDPDKLSVCARQEKGQCMLANTHSIGLRNKLQKNKNPPPTPDSLVRICALHKIKRI
jgi:hypothetical protein